MEVSDNKIGDDGAKYIGEGISKLTLLTYLNYIQDNINNFKIIQIAFINIYTIR